MHARVTATSVRRIACITTRFSTGGAEMNALMLTQQFRLRGYEAELWSLYRAGDLDHGDTPVRVMWPGTPSDPLKFARMAANLRRQIGDFRPDAILSFQPLANILTALAMAGKGRFVASQRNPSESQRGPIRWAEGVVGSTPLYDANVAVSHAVSDSYAGYSASYRRRLTVIYNGLPPLVHTADDQATARARLGLPAGVPLIGNIGRLHEQKNPEFLIDLAALLPDVHVMLAGDGPDEATLRARAAALADDAARRIHFVGRVAGEDVTRCYRALDIFAFPSRYEGFGRSLVEAMSLGVPVLANDLPITREVVGDCGLLAPLDPGTWAAAVRRMLAGQTIDLTAARERALGFGLGAMVDKYLAVLDPSSSIGGRT